MSDRLFTANELRAMADVYEAVATKLMDAANLLSGKGEGAKAIQPSRETRAGEIVRFLSDNPGSRRRDIHRGTGIPHGSVDMVLTPKSRAKHSIRLDSEGRYWADGSEVLSIEDHA